MAISEIVLLALNERKFKNYSGGCQSSAKKFETLVMLVRCVLCCLDIYIICFIEHYCGVFFSNSYLYWVTGLIEVYTKNYETNQ